MSLFLSLFEYPPQEFVGNGELNSVETNWTWSICPRIIRFFTRFWGIAWRRNVTGEKLAELKSIISIYTSNAAAKITWLSAHLYASIIITQNAACRCWLGTQYLILGFVKNDLLQPGVQSDGFPHHQKVDLTGHGKNNYHHPTHQQFLNFEAITSSPNFQYLLNIW